VTTILRVGQWEVARRILANAPTRVRAAIANAVAQEAQYLRGEIVKGLRTQSPGGKKFEPLAASTLEVRRFRNFAGTKALIVRGDLRNSITVQRRSDGGAFVGVLRQARGRDGQPLANVADLNEFGSRPIVTVITPRMRRFLAIALGDSVSQGGGGGGQQTGIIVHRIPARPFIRPVVDVLYGNADVTRRRFLTRVGALLGGDFGRMGGTVPR
jgi:hypothetical protein